MTYILAVDDDPEVLDTLGRVLERESFDVSLARSAAEALTLLDKRAPSAMILDIMMPGMDGVKLSEKLKQLDPAVKIIAVTGQATETHQSALRKLGVNVILRKPYQICRLLEAVQSVLL